MIIASASSTRWRVRGLTILELLASLVILSMLAATCVPLLQHARQLINSGGTDVEPNLLSLAHLADQVMTTPGSHGIESLEQITVVELPWPDDPGLPPVCVQRLRAQDEAPDHAWIVFTCNSSSVYRWLALPEPEEQQ